jgi:hypothetical protein
MHIGVSPLTNRIYVGKSKQLPSGIHQWIGERHDVTEAAIKAVFEHLYNETEETGHCEIACGGFGVIHFSRQDEEKTS